MCPSLVMGKSVRSYIYIYIYFVGCLGSVTFIDLDEKQAMLRAADFSTAALDFGDVDSVKCLLADAIFLPADRPAILLDKEVNGPTMGT